MDTKIKLLIFLLFTCLSVFGQEPPLNLAVRLQITSAVGSDPYTVTGIVSDDLSRFIADDIQVGDSLYVLDGSFVYVLAITSITSVVGPTIVFVANDPNNAGISLPTGQAAVIRPTTNYKLPTYISGLRDDLRSAIMNRQAQLIDNITGGGAASITDFISAGAGVPPSASASANGGETWRNMTTGELWGSNGSVWYPYTRGPKECQDTVLVSSITVQSGGSVTTGSPLVRNTSGVWQHMYNHPSGTNLVPDGVVTDIIVGGKAIIQYCGVRKGSGATPNTSYYVDQSVSTGFTTTKPTTNIRPLGKVASNGDFLINAGLLFSRDNNLNTVDSTFVKTTGGYSNKRETTNIARTGQVLLGTTNPITQAPASGNIQSEIDLKILHKSSQGNLPAVVVQNNNNATFGGKFLPFMWTLDSTQYPDALPFMLYQSYFPSASTAGNNTVGGIGFNLNSSGGSYRSAQPSAIIQFEQNYAANTSTGDLELWAGFNLSSNSYRPWYFTGSKSDGSNSFGLLSANTLNFKGGGSLASVSKGVWTHQLFTMGNSNTNGSFEQRIFSSGTGGTKITMRNPVANYNSSVLEYTSPYNRLLFSSDSDVQFQNKIFSFDCQNEGKAIIASSWNTFVPQDTINFGWWSGIPGAGVFDNAPEVRFITRDNGGILIGRHGQTMANYAQLGIWSNHFYISTTGPAPASTTTPGFSINNTTGNVGIYVDPSTLTGTDRLTVGGNIKTTSLAGTGTRLVTTSSTGVLTAGTAISGLMREESFTATAAQTAFTIAYSAPAVSGTSVPLRVYRNGVRLFYVASAPTTTQFTYSGTTVTTAANTTGDIITIEYLN